EIYQYQLSPADFGVEAAPLTELTGGTPAHNAKITAAILQGHGSAAQTNAVAINAGCALYVCGICASVNAGVALALDILRSGKAFGLLGKLAALSDEAQSLSSQVSPQSHIVSCAPQSSAGTR
ncbi:MAG: hypothetical protein ACRDBI_07920, partial [Shewanella sp.]